ncbi:MAG TPA: NUDIX hydrolase [Rhizomicrobium sp.]|jgi:8-oxo-dGTP diphosphatase|nr:NUDIX hydrolase [Rhizomicrobium sp.]
MTDRLNPGCILVGVGAVIWNEQGQVLLIRRTKPPWQNEWSLPGGKVEYGESLRTALLREVVEETGLHVEILGRIDVAELIRDEAAGAAGSHFVLIDFSARAVSGDAIAASDAAAVRWVSMDELKEIPLWSETRRVIALSAERFAVEMAPGR